MAVEQVTGKKVPVQVASRRLGDPPVLVADVSRAEQVLNWKAKRNLENMVATAWNWAQRKNEVLGHAPSTVS